MSIDLALLGTMSDAQLGRQVSLTRERIRQLREENGIPAFRPKAGRSREQRVMDAIAALPDDARAQLAVLAGTAPDSSVAKTLSIDAKLVRAWRDSHGVKVYAAGSAYSPDDEIVLRNANIPVKEAAARVRCSLMTVWRYRNGRR